MLTPSPNSQTCVVKTKLRRGDVIRIFLFSSLFFLSNLQAQTWQEILAYNFDIVDTFDQLRDWRGTGNGDVTSQSGMPVNNDGTASIWNYYSYWAPSDNGQNWIDDFGHGTRIGDTGKSLRIDLGSSNVAGPSRLGLYFGNGTPVSGYQDLYIFWRANIPGNAWPKDLDGNYIWWDSWKFGSISHGFTDVAHWNYDTSQYWPYGRFAFVPHIKRRGSGEIAGQPAHMFEEADYETGWYSGDTWATANDTVKADYDNWMGYEIHLRLVPGEENGTVEIWQYNNTGEAALLFQDTNRRLRNNTASPGHLYNKFFFGGNNSASYAWTENMQSWYYIDDFIINDSRIGPAYFTLLNNQPPPQAPAGLKVE